MKELPIAAGRSMGHDLRPMVDAVAYVIQNDRVAAPTVRLPAAGLRLRFYQRVKPRCRPSL